jgi:ABC-type polysaccharide/polyol phosphate export permease
MISAARELTATRELFLVLVQRQLRLRTKRAWMGTVWPVIAPGFLLVLYTFVFRRVFNVPIERYPEFLLCGLLPWAFLAQTLGKTISSLSLEPELVRKRRFPYELLPGAAVASQALNFLIGLGIFMAYLAAVGRLSFTLLPVLVVPLLSILLLVSALSLVVALIDVYNHDLRQVINNLLTIWFFFVPIVYRPAMVPDGIRRVQAIDPMGMVVDGFRAVLYHGEIRNPGRLALSLAVNGALFAFSLWAFRRYSHDLPKDV